MKTLLLIASSLLILGSTFAEVITVDIPAGRKVVEITSSKWHSGCGPTTNFHAVMRTEKGFVVGSDIGLKNDDIVSLNLMPKILPPPRYTCMAYVETKNKARFTSYSNENKTVTIEVPHFMADAEVTFQDIQVAY